MFTHVSCSLTCQNLHTHGHFIQAREVLVTINSQLSSSHRRATRNNASAAAASAASASLPPAAHVATAGAAVSLDHTGHVATATREEEGLVVQGTTPVPSASFKAAAPAPVLLERPRATNQDGLVIGAKVLAKIPGNCPPWPARTTTSEWAVKLTLLRLLVWVTQILLQGAMQLGYCSF